MKKKIIYIGCPYSDKDPKIMEERYKQITSITAKLVKEGYVVFSPVTYGHVLCEFEDMPVDFDFWQNLCIKFLQASDLMLVIKLDEWENSKGLKEEVMYCKKNGIKVVEYNFNDVDSVANKVLEDIHTIELNSGVAICSLRPSRLGVEKCTSIAIKETSGIPMCEKCYDSLEHLKQIKNK